MGNRDSVKTSILRNLPIFNGIADDDLQILAPVMMPVSFKAGDDVIREGEKGHSLYIIRKGSVEVIKGGGGGEEVSVGILPEGTFFGELSLFDDHPRSATVRAVEDTEFFNITRKDLVNCLDKNVELANKLYMNTIIEIFARFRTITNNFTFSQHHLRSKNRLIKEIDRDMLAASEVQNYFIEAQDDEEINRKNGILRHYLYLPSKAIGGDFISIINDPSGNICAIIADVEGHGISASLATGVLKSAFSFLAPEYGSSPELFMSKLNNHLCRELNKLYATCYYAYINVKEMKIIFAKAGHHHPLFWKDALKHFVELDFTGPVLGLIDGAQYESQTHDINPGDRIVFYTDGIVEQRDSQSRMYGPERLSEVIRQNLGCGGEYIINAVITDLHDYTGLASYDDDITMLYYEFGDIN